MDMAGIADGMRVLDVAAGSGGQTLQVARRVGPTGSVLATDLAPRILAYVAGEARAAGLTNVATQVMDAENPDVEPGSFDAAVSRMGVMLMPGPAAALQGMRRSVKQGGRVAVMVGGVPEKSPFIAVPAGIIRRHAQLPPPAPGAPGVLALGRPGGLEDAFARAGFDRVETRRVEQPLRAASAAEALSFMQDAFGALHQMLEGRGEAEKEAAWAEVEEALRRYEGADGLEIGAEFVLGVGTA
jgi:SAM-dependent methyltransferase